jgi:hypothetical protein
MSLLAQAHPFLRDGVRDLFRFDDLIRSLLPHHLVTFGAFFAVKHFPYFRKLVNVKSVE